MKQLNSIKKVFLTALMGTAAAANAQTSHPLAFSNSVGSNFYKNYVGVRLQVVNPTSIAGDYHYTTSNDGSASTAVWGGFVTTPIVDKACQMFADDSFGCSAVVTPGMMDNKIALVWRGPISTPCEFGVKALKAQQAGAVACVLINEYEGEGPVGMAAGASGASVTIPVFMIGNEDGKKLSGRYHAISGPSDSVRMTITPWGLNNANDLGFVPGGLANFHNFATPAHQLFAAGTPLAYKGISGAYVANYGTNDATNVQLKAKLTFTPTGGSSATTVRTDSVTLASFPALDSIWTFFGPEYTISDLGGPGRFDISYDVTSPVTDDFDFDNHTVMSFYATDSLFCKGRYDFAADHPVATLWTGSTTGADPLMWGVPYFVAQGGSQIKDILFSASSGPGPLTAGNLQFYIFKWNDGDVFADSVIENGELQLVGTVMKGFDGVEDSSFDFFNTGKPTSDTDFSGLYNQPIQLSANSWYLIAEVSDNKYAIGCDGINSGLPRSYGRKHFHNVSELYNPISAGTRDIMLTTPTTAFLNQAFGGGSFDIDSVFFNSQIGLIPQMAMKVQPFMPNAVAETPKVTGHFDVFPNPASSVINFSLALDNAAQSVSYRVVDGLGRTVLSETHKNVQSEKFTVNTANMAAGNYFVVVTADGRSISRKFTVIK